jgi:hypothetical protein
VERGTEGIIICSTQTLFSFLDTPITFQQWLSVQNGPAITFVAGMEGIHSMEALAPMALSLTSPI